MNEIILVRSNLKSDSSLVVSLCLHFTLLRSRSRKRFYDTKYRRNSFTIGKSCRLKIQRFIFDNYLNWVSVQNLHRYESEIYHYVDRSIISTFSGFEATHFVNLLKTRKVIVYLFYDNQISSVSDLRSESHSGYLVFFFYLDFSDQKNKKNIIYIYIYIERFL